jgi:hypothetical protein
VTDTTNHRWRFFRVGGFDQVRIERAADLTNLGNLDPKLWVALACPAKDVFFDAKTLAALDADQDGSIRVPEVVAAAQWAGRVLRDASPLERADGVLPLAAINTDDAEGARLLASAKRILAARGHADADRISLAETGDLSAIYAGMRHNGDGVVPATLAGDTEDAEAITLIGKTLGALPDRSGSEGVDEERIQRFFTDAAAVLAWDAAGQAVHDVPGGDAAAAGAALGAVRAKVDDFFTRVRLAGYDASATGPLNPPGERYAALAANTLSQATAEIATLPLATVAPGAALPLRDGLNPAWEGAVATLRDKVVAPVLGARDTLDFAGWQQVCGALDAWQAWLSARPDTPVAGVDIATLRRLASEERRARLLALVADDKAAAPEADGIASVEKLLLLCRDLMAFCNNFVAFRDFYARREAIFLAGHLYLDSRTCDLVLRVQDAGRHATLAALAGSYLVYCDCVRGARKQSIVAAFTDGDSDQLRVGRNGVFWDREGNDWQATITKVVENPISVREAFWTPYRRVARFIGEQIEKFASSRSADVDKQLAGGVADKAGAVTAGAPAAPAAPFDIARFAGIFAAIGLALGALGTALAAILSGFLSLPVWQMPLVVLGAMLLVSGPSMLLAWLKLRRRNLGPLLDANGWAVNARALLNVPFGKSLTHMAVLPAGAERNLHDDFAPRKPVWPWVVAALLAAAIGWFYWQKHQAAQEATAAPEPAAAVAEEPAAAAPAPQP